MNSAEIKSFYETYGDEIIAKRLESPYPLRRYLHRTQYETIAITGHTDRLGTDTYNKKLSERRALEVKRYLSKKGIDANKIQTKWVGATEPQTAPGACEGLNRKETIACLAPDRRVELEVVGMQEQSSARR